MSLGNAEKPRSQAGAEVAVAVDGAVAGVIPRNKHRLSEVVASLNAQTSKAHPRRKAEGAVREICRRGTPSQSLSARRTRDVSWHRG
jgi:hypothetical protein